MKKLLLSVAGAIALGTYATAQTTLFSENFETGGTGFTLNTSDLSSGSTYNTWLINNSYTGGSGDIICLGLPFTYTVTSTSNQPGGITNSPNSTYMHITSQEAIIDGITCSSYAAADGLCTMDEYNFAKMSTTVSTIGMTNVNFDFWWICGGSATIFGEVYYSTDGGSTWILSQSNLNNQPSWVQTSLTDPAWENQASLTFGFRFVNLSTVSALEPGFSIDDVTISATSGSNTITTGTSLTPVEWCEGSTVGIAVDFTSTGTFNAGNVYTAELSDASGSFASPTSIGSLTSTANSGTISATVPGSVTAGTGYRVRVVSGNPAATGSDNTVDLVVNALPTVTQQPFSDVCEGGGTVTLVGGSPSGGSYSGSGVTGNNFDPAQTGQGSFPITYMYTDGNGCTSDAIEAITVIASPTVTLDPYSNVCDDDAFFTLTGGSPSNGTYTGNGVSAGVFDPGTAGVGTHTITYSFTDGNGCTGTATETITVEVCGGIGEQGVVSFQLTPNPTSSSFEITSEITPESIELLDMSGRVFRTFEANQESHFVGDVPVGVYIVRINANGLFSEQRLVVQ